MPFCLRNGIRNAEKFLAILLYFRTKTRKRNYNNIKAKIPILPCFHGKIGIMAE